MQLIRCDVEGCHTEFACDVMQVRGAAPLGWREENMSAMVDVPAEVQASGAPAQAVQYIHRHICPAHPQPLVFRQPDPGRHMGRYLLSGVALG